MNYPKFPIDAEMGFLTPVGDQNLFFEDPSKDFINDNRMFRADGDWLNFNTGDCKSKCNTLFPSVKEAFLNQSCKNICKQKCNLRTCKGYEPTRASICIESGRNSDCSQKTVVDTEAPGSIPGKTPLSSTQQTSSVKSPETTSGKPATKYVIGGLVLVTLIGVGFLAYQRFKK